MNADRIKRQVAKLNKEIADLDAYVTALKKQPDGPKNRKDLDVASERLLALQGNFIALHAANNELLKAARDKDYYG